VSTAGAVGTLTWPLRSAQSMAEYPSRVMACRSAPSSTSRRAVSARVPGDPLAQRSRHHGTIDPGGGKLSPAWPRIAAWCRAVKYALLRSSDRAPASMSLSALEVWPYLVGAVRSVSAAPSAQKVWPLRNVDHAAWFCRVGQYTHNQGGGDWPGRHLAARWSALQSPGPREFTSAPSDRLSAIPSRLPRSDASHRRRFNCRCSSRGSQRSMSSIADTRIPLRAVEMSDSSAQMHSHVRLDALI
jgi:hypothetical protein